MSPEKFSQDSGPIFSKPFEMPKNMPVFDKAKLEATAAKAEQRRQRRMRQIVAEVQKVFDSHFPQDAADFALTHETVTKVLNSETGEMESFPYDMAPAYAVLLALKDKPENKFWVMHLFKGNVEVNVGLEKSMVYNNIPGFSGRLGQGIQQLRSEASGATTE